MQFVKLFLACYQVTAMKPAQDLYQRLEAVFGLTFANSGWVWVDGSMSVVGQRRPWILAIKATLRHERITGSRGEEVWFEVRTGPFWVVVERFERANDGERRVTSEVVWRMQRPDPGEFPDLRSMPRVDATRIGRREADRIYRMLIEDSFGGVPVGVHGLIEPWSLAA